MVSHNIGSGDPVYQYTATGVTSGSEFEVIWYGVGIVVFVVWWLLNDN